MTLAESLAAIDTQYFKVAHLLLVTYSIYLSKEPLPDQTLLELELQIRHEHPRILVTYSNKCLYHFRLGHWQSPETDSGRVNAENTGENGAKTGENPNFQLESLYPQLSLKHEKTVSVEQLANPAQASRKAVAGGNENPRDEYLPYASLSFIKAVKKALLYNMSCLGQMNLFGNYLLGRVAQTSSQYRVVQIDPVLLANGDLLALVTQRDMLPLFAPSVLNLDHVIPEFASCFVIYVVPSGLRCHLYDTQNLSLSFTKTPPKSCGNLLRLLKSSTGVDLTSKTDILWVKLIPNLQHLNNQTSDISRFIHDVDNRKYILWPWDLCVIQFGSVERARANQDLVAEIDPMSLINDYLSFSLSVLETAAKPTPLHTDAPTASASLQPGSIPVHPFSVPSVPSVATGGLSATENETTAPQALAQDRESFSDHINNQKEATVSAELKGDNVSGRPTVAEEAESGADSDLDLFGDGSDLDDNGDGTSDEKKDGDIGSVAFDSERLISPKGMAMQDDNSQDNTEPNIETFPSALPRTSPSKATSDPAKNPDSSSYMGIPKSEMIYADIRLFTPGSYDDPGAPPPIIPTPAIPQLNTFGMTHQNFSGGFPSSLPPPNLAGKAPLPQRDRRQLESSWAFSPIVFNPKIKNSIDTKYGKGGKFYVDTEESSGPELDSRKPRLRETSVVAYDVNVSQDTTSAKPQYCTSDSPLSTFEGREGDLNLTIAKSAGSHADSFVALKSANDDDLGMLSDESNNEAELEDDEDFEEEEYESDEDEELPVSDLNGPTLRLNSRANELLDTVPDPVHEPQRPLNSAVSLQPQNQASNSAYLSPLSYQLKELKPTRGSSPFGLGIDTDNISVSPAVVLNVKPGMNSEIVSPLKDYSVPEQGQKDLLVADANTPLSSSGTPNGVSESTNCLPLILRSINVQSIPNIFLLNKVPGAWGPVNMPTGFDMDVDEEEDDIDHKDAGLFVRAKYMDELLNWLVPNIVFDLGLTSFEQHTQLRLPDFFSDRVSTNTTDENASHETALAFSSIFPQSQTVPLDELLSAPPESHMSPNHKQSPDSKSHIVFLDDMDMDPNGGSELLDTEGSQTCWDSFYPSGANFESRSMKNTMHKVDESSIVSFDDVKIRSCKNRKEIINLNIVGTQFWRYLGFDPINGAKNFQVLLLTECSPRHDARVMSASDDSEFLNMVKYNYANMRLGSIKNLNLQTFETRPDLEGIADGLLVVNKDVGDASYSDYYKRANKKLKNLAEMIKLDLINRTNRFELDRPLLLLFIDHHESVNSALQISKLCRNFQVSLNDHQLSLVEVFAHVIPASHVFKLTSNSRRLRYISDTKLAKISTILYNKCPNVNPTDSKMTHDKDEPKRLFTQLMKDAPTSLNFKFFSKPGKESLNTESTDDMFIHVAYERLIDKNWICAAWSDPLGIVTKMTSWYCPPSTKEGRDVDAHDLGTIICKIWDVSIKLFKRLNDDTLQRMCGSERKKFLVLARVSSIIPDDELLHWKRLTAKYKEISLIVLTTNRAPKYLFEANTSTLSPVNGGANVNPNQMNTLMSIDERKARTDGSDFIQSLNIFPSSQNSHSPAGGMAMSASPMTNALSFHSPQQFPNAPSGVFSPHDNCTENRGSDADLSLNDTSHDCIGIIPKVALPSCNSPTRHSMRTGYLVKESLASQLSPRQTYAVFEVSLLSCSNYWNLETVMKITLKHFKKLTALNDILGIYDRSAAGRDGHTMSRERELQSLVPWHVNAVVKALDYLVHVHVEE